MKANSKHLLILALLLNTTPLATVYASDEVDAEFLEFLADMEEVTGAGFDRWLDDGSLDTNENITDNKSTDENEQSKEK